MESAKQESHPDVDLKAQGSDARQQGAEDSAAPAVPSSGVPSKSASSGPAKMSPGERLSLQKTMEQVKMDEAAKRRASSGIAVKVSDEKPRRPSGVSMNPNAEPPSADKPRRFSGTSLGLRSGQRQDQSIMEEKNRIMSRKARGGMERLSPASLSQRSTAATSATTGTSMRSMRSIPSMRSVNSGGPSVRSLRSRQESGRSMRSGASNRSMRSVGSMRSVPSLGGLDRQDSSSSGGMEPDSDAAIKIRALSSRRLSGASATRTGPLFSDRRNSFNSEGGSEKSLPSYPCNGNKSIDSCLRETKAISVGGVRSEHERYL